MVQFQYEIDCLGCLMFTKSKLQLHLTSSQPKIHMGSRMSISAIANAEITKIELCNIIQHSHTSLDLEAFGMKGSQNLRC